MKIYHNQNQFGRRNLSAYDRSLLALKLKPVIAAKAKENQGERNDLNIVKNSCQSPEEPAPVQKSKSARENKTDYQVAQKAGVSEDTIQMFGEGSSTKKESSQETRQKATIISWITLFSGTINSLYLS